MGVRNRACSEIGIQSGKSVEGEKSQFFFICDIPHNLLL
jgi:hypothetical protein